MSTRIPGRPGTWMTYCRTGGGAPLRMSTRRARSSRPLSVGRPPDPGLEHRPDHPRPAAARPAVPAQVAPDVLGRGEPEEDGALEHPRRHIPRDDRRHVDERPLRPGDRDAVVNPEVDRAQDPAAVDGSDVQSRAARPWAPRSRSSGCRLPEGPKAERRCGGTRRRLRPPTGTRPGPAARSTPWHPGTAYTPGWRRTRRPASRRRLIWSTLNPRRSSSSLVTTPYCLAARIWIATSSHTGESQPPPYDSDAVVGA